MVTREWGIIGGILVKGTKFHLDRRTKLKRSVVQHDNCC
jgi:hypothetical protein